jgi:hypothetical protein
MECITLLLLKPHSSFYPKKLSLTICHPAIFPIPRPHTCVKSPKGHRSRMILHQPSRAMLWFLMIEDSEETSAWLPFLKFWNGKRDWSAVNNNLSMINK